MDKTLKLYVYVDGVNDTPFPQGAEEPIEIGSFRYDAKRMGGAPIITATVMYPTCLDSEWNEKVYAKFNGEKYFLKQTPTSSHSNEDERYKHELELISERVILDNVYFYDAVAEDEPNTDDKPVSNSTKFVFWGSVYDFANRLKASLKYSGIDYDVVVDGGVSKEEKLVSFEDTFFSNAIQEAYNTFDIPYYFTYNKELDRKEIHFGYSPNTIDKVFKYGVDDALVSITKRNANYKIVNRITGTGSSDNIPFYYPNNSPKGDIIAEVRSDSQIAVNIIDYEKFSSKVDINSVVTYNAQLVSISKVTNSHKNSIGDGSASSTVEFGYTGANITYKMYLSAQKGALAQIYIRPTGELSLYKDSEDKEGEPANVNIVARLYIDGVQVGKADVNNGHTFNINIDKDDAVVDISLQYTPSFNSSTNKIKGWVGLNYSINKEAGWYYNDDQVELEDLGLYLSDSRNLREGDTITQRCTNYTKPSQVLMPSIYRESNGAKRFYNAIGDEYENPYTKENPKEHIITVEDIKPSIEGMMVNGERIDMFEAFAYDVDDNDETYEDEEGNVYFKHPYFFAKLKPLGFNLFDHAIENQPMTISFTSGACGACSFEIGVTEGYPQKNPVQVDENGYLIKDKNGRILCGCEGTDQVITEYQESQQDTTNNSVWIALRKEEQTYGTLMPTQQHQPNSDDTFVILGINLPSIYIEEAEKRLEEELLKYMKENNTEKFNFSVLFSRIFFEESEENKEILHMLNENARITIAYDKDKNELNEEGLPKDKTYTLYVNSFSYQMSEGEVLPEITVELDEALTISQNALQKAINSVKSEVGRALSNIDILGLSTPFFLRKDADDEANGVIDFKKGVKFGEGGKVEVLDNNSAKLTIEYLEVTKKASFSSLEIQEKTHAGGQLLVTPAAIICGGVEDGEGYYRCYFQVKNESGEEIYNQFVVGDQAICQVFNTWGSKYYWRLVVGIGEDYIDLSKTECDSSSDIPAEGDRIVQFGNQIDEERQNAIVISAHGSGAPYIIQYKGIKDFSLSDVEIVTKLSSTENIFTGKVHMELGSDIIGGSNMLRNSGFTGDYLSAPLADEQVLKEASEMFNPPLIYWDDEDSPAVGATVQDSDVSVGGKELSLVDGGVTQKLYQRVISDETYVLSFKAKGILISETTNEETGEVTKVYSSLNATFGGNTTTIELTDGWKYYATKVVAKETSSHFSIASSNATICDLQLERGSVATDWGRSFLDNSSDRVYYQAGKYIQDALKGFTDIYGGLILTGLIKVGLQEEDVMTKETAGMSGQYHNDNDVAFWAGGSEEQAEDAIKQTGVNEANFAVSHGGKVVMNDAIVRGTIYADDGEFTGIINADGGRIGNLLIENGAIHARSGCGDNEGDWMESTYLDEDSFSIARYYNDGYSCAIGNETRLFASGIELFHPQNKYGEGFSAIKSNGYPTAIQAIDAKAGLVVGDINYSDINGEDNGKYSIYAAQGVFAGMRTTTQVVPSSSSSWALGPMDYNLLLNKTTGSVTISIPSDPLDGQEYIIETKGQGFIINSSKEIFNHMDDTHIASASKRGVYRLKYYAEASTWTFCCISN